MADFRLGRLKFNWRGDWAASTAYVIDDIVKFGANTYVCTTNHTSVANEANWYSTDLSNWSLQSEGVRSRGEYSNGTYYKVNDLVKFGNTQFRVLTGFASTVGFATFVGSAFATEYVSGFLSEGQWNPSTEYQIGDVITYNGSSYVAITTAPAGEVPVEYIDTKWQVLSEGINGSGISTYSDNNTYYRGDLVQIGGDIYRLVVGTASSINPVGSASTIWAPFNTGLNYVGSYNTTTTYYKGSVVEYASSSYVGVGTQAILNVTPGTDASKWAALAIGDSNAVLTTVGDLLYRDASSPTRLAIGHTGYALGVSTTGVPEWTVIGDATRIYYVDPEKGSDTFPGHTPDLAFRTLKYACDNASAITNITDFTYDRHTGISTITAPAHGILYPNITIKLANIEFECLSGGRAYSVSGFQYDKASGISTVTVSGTLSGITTGTVVRLKNLEFTCPGGSGITTTFFPDGTQGYNFTVTSVTGGSSFIINVGISTITHIYVSGGTAFVGVDTTIFPRSVASSFFTVDEIVDNNTIKVNVGVSTIDHTYVGGGSVINLSPAVIRLSASEFAEQLPILVPAFTTIVGNSLRASKIRPAAGISTDGITPNNRQTMFKLSDATTIQGLNVSGLVGFNYDEDHPYELDYTTVRTGLGTTACGVYFAFNESSPIITKSPYVKDCTSFGDPATDGTGAGAGVGVFMDGALHDTGAKSMVFDAFTNVLSDGAGFILDKDCLAEIVSCFTYYAKWGYYAGGGSRIRSVGGNNSYGDYGVIASGFSTAETARSGRVFGDRLDIAVGSQTGTISVGNTMVGTTSGARATLINDQIPSERIYFKYWPGYGNVGLGTTGFIDGETIDFIGAGTTGAIRVASATSSISGQKGVLIELDLIDVNNPPLVGDAIGFTTSAYGEDKVNGEPRYYIINTVTGITTSITINRGYDGLAPVTYTGRATVRISPEKTVGTYDSRTGVGTDINAGGSLVDIRTRFSNARLTGHDFLSIGTGNKVETGYPNVNEANIAQGNETNVFGPGKVFFVSTDQGGNFRVGEFFSVNQLTGAATLDATAFNLSGLSELRLGAIGGQVGEAINEFSSDETMSGNSNSACPTEYAVVGYLKRGGMGVDAMLPPVGTTAQRPDTPLVGMLRYNSTKGNYETWNGTAWIPVGGFLNNVDVSTTYTASAFELLWCNTSGGGFTVTLPSSPSKGDVIRFVDVANTFDSSNLTIARNGKLIGGLAENMTVNTEGAAFDLIFYNDTYGWRIFTV